MHNLISIGSLSTTSYKYKKHSHRYWEITYYFGGSGVNIAGGKEYPFSDGTIVCIPPEIQHEDRSECGYKNIFFMVETFNISSAYPLLVHDNADRDFLYILKQLYKEYYSERPAETNITNALLNVLYEYLTDFLGSKSSNPYIDFAKREIIENLSSPSFSLSELMAQIPLHPDYFRRQFKESVGVSPLEYIQRLRINNAKQLLESSSFPLKDICQICGYDDPYYFSRIFKKITGVSPKSYRKNGAQKK